LHHPPTLAMCPARSKILLIARCRPATPAKEMRGWGLRVMAPGLKGQPALILAVSGGGDHEKTAANIRLVLDYYEYRLVGEFAEGMGDVAINKEEHSDIYNELFSLGGKLSAAIK